MTVTSIKEMGPEDFSKKDPLLRLSVKINKSPLVMSLAWVLIINLIRLIIAAIYGQLRTNGNLVGFIDDPGQYVTMLYGVVLWSFYFWIPRGISSVCKCLYENQVISNVKADKFSEREKITSYEDFVGALVRSCNHWWWFFISIFISLTIYLLVILPGYLNPIRQSTNWAFNNAPSLIMGGVFMVLSLYAIVMFIFYCLISIFWLRRLFTGFDVRIRPFHPDKAGGLSPLGNFTLRLSYLITASGLLLVAIPITRDYVMHGTLRLVLSRDIIVGIIAYLILAPIAFFAPLSVAHSSMNLAKSSLLLQIDENFQEEMTSLNELFTKKEQITQDKVNNFKALQTLYETAYKFPVWPFNTENMTRFTTTYLSPILLALVISILGKWLGL